MGNINKYGVIVEKPRYQNILGFYFGDFYYYESNQKYMQVLWFKQINETYLTFYSYTYIKTNNNCIWLRDFTNDEKMILSELKIFMNDEMDDYEIRICLKSYIKNRNYCLHVGESTLMFFPEDIVEGL